MSAQKRLLTTVSIGILFMAMVTLPSIALSAQPRVREQAATPPNATIPYNARLADPSGQIVDDGMYDFMFELYQEATGGAPLWSEVQTGVAVKSGNLAVSLGSVTTMPAAATNNKEVWLAVSLRGPGEKSYTALTPRQRLEPGGPASPAALTCPHSHFGDYWSGNSPYYGLAVDNAGTGDGIRAYSRSTVFSYAAIYGYNIAAAGNGTGVYGASYQGVGVYAASGSGDGLEATTAATTTKSAVYAHATDANGVWAVSTNKEGVHGASTARYGVSGNSTNSYGGYFYSENYRALYASGNPNWYAAYIVNRGGSSLSALYVDGGIIATGSKSGYVTDLAMNNGTEALETGDVVVVTGYGDPVLGQIPVVKVRKASLAYSKAVVGIVDQPMTVNASESSGEKEPPFPAGARAAKADNTAVFQGQYVSIVTLGSFKAVKVDATARAIQPGDLLVTSSNPGYAMASDNPKPGTIIGKAMSSLETGTGIIPVMVTLH